LAARPGIDSKQFSHSLGPSLPCACLVQHGS
jgi:hypothetical protein